MRRSHFHFLTAMPRGVVVGLEVLALGAVIMAGAITYGLYRLSKAPIDLEFARPYIEAVLSGHDRTIQIKVDRASLHWPHLEGGLELRLQKLNVFRNGQMIVDVNDLSLALAKAPLLIGRIRPERLILRTPVLNFERDAASRLHFSLIPSKGAGAAGTETRSDVTRAILPMLFGEQGTDYGVLSRVNEVSIERAQIRVADATQGMTWRLKDVDVSFRAVDVGVYGSVNVQLPKGQKFSLVATYHRGRDDLKITSQFRDFSLPTFVGRFMGVGLLRSQHLPLSGAFELKGSLRDFSVDGLKLSATAARGSFRTQDLVGVDFPVTGVRVDLGYDRAAAALRLNDFAFNLGKIPVRATGEIKQQKPTGPYIGAVDLHVDRLPLSTVRELWPDEYRDLPIALWLTHKLSGGTVTALDVRVPVWAGRKERQLTLLAMRPSVGFAYENLDVDYRAPLYPIKAAAGNGTYEHDVLALNVTRGTIQDMKIKDSTLVIHDLAKAGAGMAEIRLGLTGPLQTVLRYISLDPIKLGDRLPIKPDRVQGQGKYTVDISFPTVHDLPAEAVEVDVNARLNDISLPGLVKGQTLGGGPYDLQVLDGMINLKGQGTLSGRAITLDMTQPVQPAGHDVLMKVKARVDSDTALRRAFGADLSFLEGPVSGDVLYTEFSRGDESVSVSADLTPTRIVFDALRYEKAAGLPGSAKLDLTLKKGRPTSGQNLDIDGPNLKIRGGALKFGTVEGAINLTEANLPQITLGKSQIGARYRRDDGRMKIDVTGERLDLSPYMNSKNDQTTGPVVALNAQVDSLSFGGDQDLKNGDLSVSLNARADLEQLRLMGTAGAGAAVIRYLPDDQGRMTFDLQARDAGAFLRVMGIYPNMVGGDLTIKGSPIGNNNRDVKGDLVIKKFSVVKAPILAQLLSSMSPEGVNEQLSSKGIGFDRLESGFAWLRRPSLDLMSFREGRTSGSALGLTFDGLYDRRKGTVEITGTLIPISGLNTFASNIPLLGQILTGGKGSALFAATYSIKGPADKPQTTINPLSVLTPGILRRIFFESAPKDPLRPQKTTP